MPSWAVPAIIISSIIAVTVIAGCCYIYYKRHTRPTNLPDQTSIIEIATLKQSFPSHLLEPALDVSLSITPAPPVAPSNQTLQSIFFSSIPEDKNSDTPENPSDEEQTLQVITEPYLLNDYCIDPIRQTGGSHSCCDPDPYSPPDAEHTDHNFTSSH